MILEHSNKKHEVVSNFGKVQKNKGFLFLGGGLYNKMWQKTAIAIIAMFEIKFEKGNISG